jgi:hypothetical protein
VVMGGCWPPHSTTECLLLLCRRSLKTPFGVVLFTCASGDRLWCCYKLSALLFAAASELPVSTVCFCFRSNSTCLPGFGFVCSKGQFMPAMLCHRGLWYVNSSVLAVGLFAVHTLANAHSSFFCYSVSRPYAGSLGSVW